MSENPRLAGIYEHLRRAELHLAEAHQVKDYDSAFPKLIAAVYPARAALELMREAAKAGELTIDPNAHATVRPCRVFDVSQSA